MVSEPACFETHKFQDSAKHALSVDNLDLFRFLLFISEHYYSIALCDAFKHLLHSSSRTQRDALPSRQASYQSKRHDFRCSRQAENLQIGFTATT